MRRHRNGTLVSGGALALALSACFIPRAIEKHAWADFAGQLRHQQVGDVDYGYRRFGSGPPLVLICGITMTMTQWDLRLLKDLRHSFDVVIFDNPGIGQTTDSSKAPLSIEGMAAGTIALAEALGIDTTRGAVISQVIPDSAADDAGMHEGDVVVAVNDREITDASSLRNTIGLFRADDEIEVSFLRDGQRMSKRIRIRAIEPPAGQGLKINKRLEGIRLADIDDQDGPQGQRGVRVVEIVQNSLAWQSGLREGDLIISVNKQPIYSLKDVERAVDDEDAMLLLNVVRGNSGLFIVIP